MPLNIGPQNEVLEVRQTKPVLSPLAGTTFRIFKRGVVNSAVAAGTARDNLMELFVDARYSPFSVELASEDGGQVSDPTASLRSAQPLRYRVRTATGDLFPLTIESVCSLSPEYYARLVWSRGGHAVKMLLWKAGIKDAQAPGGRLTPSCPASLFPAPEEEDE